MNRSGGVKPPYIPDSPTPASKDQGVEEKELTLHSKTKAAIKKTLPREEMPLAKRSVSTNFSRNDPARKKATRKIRDINRLFETKDTPKIYNQLQKELLDISKTVQETEVNGEINQTPIDLSIKSMLNKKLDQEVIKAIIEHKANIEKKDTKNIIPLPKLSSLVSKTVKDFQTKEKLNSMGGCFLKQHLQTLFKNLKVDISKKFPDYQPTKEEIEHCANKNKIERCIPENIDTYDLEKLAEHIINYNLYHIADKAFQREKPLIESIKTKGKKTEPQKKQISKIKKELEKSKKELEKSKKDPEKSKKEYKEIIEKEIQENFTVALADDAKALSDLCYEDAKKRLMEEKIIESLVLDTLKEKLGEDGFEERYTKKWDQIKEQFDSKISEAILDLEHIKKPQNHKDVKSNHNNGKPPIEEIDLTKKTDTNPLPKVPEETASSHTQDTLDRSRKLTKPTIFQRNNNATILQTEKTHHPNKNKAILIKSPAKPLDKEGAPVLTDEVTKVPEKLIVANHNQSLTNIERAIASTFANSKAIPEKKQKEIIINIDDDLLITVRENPGREKPDISFKSSSKKSQLFLVLNREKMSKYINQLWEEQYPTQKPKTEFSHNLVKTLNKGKAPTTETTFDSTKNNVEVSFEQLIIELANSFDHKELAKRRKNNQDNLKEIAKIDKEIASIDVGNIISRIKKQRNKFSVQKQIDSIYAITEPGLLLKLTLEYLKGDSRKGNLLIAMAQRLKELEQPPIARLDQLIVNLKNAEAHYQHGLPGGYLLTGGKTGETEA